MANDLFRLLPDSRDRLPLTDAGIVSGNAKAIYEAEFWPASPVSASASQITALPTQAATATVLVQASAAQTTALPTQAGTETVTVTETGAQTTSLPSQTATATVLIQFSAGQTTALPTQAATGTVEGGAAAAPVETGHSAGVSVAYRRRWYEYVQSRRRKGTWRPGEGSLEEIIRGVYEAEDAVSEPKPDLEAARTALEASREAARGLEAGQQREAVLRALLASQRAIEAQTQAALGRIAERQRQARQEFQAVQEAVMAAALEWERREQDDLEVLLLVA